MRRRWIAAVVVAGCGPGVEAIPDGAPAPPDAAAPDAWPTLDDLCPRVELPVTGASPEGALDDFRYARVRYAGHWCSYALDLRLARDLESAEDAPYVWLQVPVQLYDIAEPVTGELAASACVVHPEVGCQASTPSARFTAARIDPLDAPEPRVVGRFVADQDGWALDLAIDLPLCGSYTCP